MDRTVKSTNDHFYLRKIETNFSMDLPVLVSPDATSDKYL